MSAAEQKHSLKTEFDELERETDAPSLKSKKPVGGPGVWGGRVVSVYIQKQHVNIQKWFLWFLWYLNWVGCPSPAGSWTPPCPVAAR